MFDLSDLPNTSWKNSLQWYSTDFPKWDSPYFSPVSFKICFLVYATNKAKNSTYNNLLNCETMIDSQCLSKGKLYKTYRFSQRREMKGNQTWQVYHTAQLSSGQHTIQQLQHKNRPT